MARGGGGSAAALAGLLLIVGAVLFLLTSKDETVSRLEDKLNTRFPSLDVQSSVDKVLGYRTGGGLQGFLTKMQQKFGTDIFPERRTSNAPIQTGIDQTPIVNTPDFSDFTYAAGYGPESVLAADDGGSGGMA